MLLDRDSPPRAKGDCPYFSGCSDVDLELLELSIQGRQVNT